MFDVPVEDYGAYLFAGLLPWTFLVQTIHDGLQSISLEPDLVRRAPFPYVFLPLSRVVVMVLPFLVLLVGFVLYSATVGDRHASIRSWCRCSRYRSSRWSCWPRPSRCCWR